jgi:hypothetical protein
MRSSVLGVRPSILVMTCMVFAFLATTGSQCARVEDPMKAGLDIQAAAAGCIQDCNDAARVARSAEQELHSQNVNACLAIPPGDARAACLEAEDERHDARMDQISEEQEACKDGCEHEQGLGSVGE